MNASIDAVFLVAYLSFVLNLVTFFLVLFSFKRLLNLEEKPNDHPSGD